MPGKKVTYEELLGIGKPMGETEKVVSELGESPINVYSHEIATDSKPVGTPVRIPPRSSEHPMGLLRGIHWVLFHKDPPHLRGIGKPEVIDLIIEGLEDLK